MRAALLLPFLLCLDAAAQEDPFDALDRQLNAQFGEAERTIDARFEAVEAAVDRAFKGLSRKIEVRWGEDARMPERARWVTYNEQHDARVSVDYAAGEVVLEAVVPSPGALDHSLQNMSTLANTVLVADCAVIFCWIVHVVPLRV